MGPLVDSSGSDKYTSWLPSNDPAREGRQHRCRSQAGRHTRPSRYKKDTAVRVSTTRQQGLAFRDTRGSQLPLLLPSRLPTNFKLVSSTSWTPQADEPLTDKPKQDHLDEPREGIGNQGATTKGGKEKERSNFRDSLSVGERISSKGGTFRRREAGRVSQGCAERIMSCCAHLE